MAKLKKSEAFTAEREREIQQVNSSFILILLEMQNNRKLIFWHFHWFKVVESVNELAQIMKDLSVLVIDQVRRHLNNSLLLSAPEN